nr:aminomethyl-transferring glycine dehydrogenase subunit GcvPB [Actinomycetota bacterium]
MTTSLEPSAGTRAADGATPIFERSRAGRRAWSLPDTGDGTALDDLVPREHRRTEPPLLPEVSERDLVQHYTRLSQRNWAIDVGAYPLGSCTMKYNPKLAEDAAGHEGFRALHPAADEE